MITATQEPDNLNAVNDTPISRQWTRVGAVTAPTAPQSVQDTGIDRQVLVDLALKFAYVKPQFSTLAVAAQLCLPAPIVVELLDQLRSDRLVEVLGEDGPFSFHYAATDRGRLRAAHLLEICGYVGPAPVSVQTYTTMLEQQFAHWRDPTPQEAADAIADLVLDDAAVQVAGLAASSRRSLFLYGPPGNGKTSLGHLLHKTTQGDLWVPHCLGVDSEIIRVFDPRSHEQTKLTLSPEQSRRVDHRWVCIKRPFIVVGGELTVHDLELSYSPTLRYYEAPVHLKANGGTFLLDDLGCQRVDPHQLLSRWVFPLEHRIDHLTLKTGQKIQVPFRQMLIVSTNLDPHKVVDAAFLRRLGYRLYLGDPSPETYRHIFQRYAQRHGLNPSPSLIADMIDRYRRENRPMRCCEPRDLIERARDVCQYRGGEFVLNQETIDVAWRGYFGAASPVE